MKPGGGQQDLGLALKEAAHTRGRRSLLQEIGQGLPPAQQIRVPGDHHTERATSRHRTRTPKPKSLFHCDACEYTAPKLIIIQQQYLC